jgi:hypothetical protein
MCHPSAGERVRDLERSLPTLADGSDHFFQRFPQAFGQRLSIAIVQFGRLADWQTDVASAEVFEFRLCRRTFHLLKSLIFLAAHCPNGKRPLLPPLRAFGNAELYRSGVFGRCRQTRLAHRSYISRLDREGGQLLPTRAAHPGRLMSSEQLDDNFPLNSSGTYVSIVALSLAEKMRDSSIRCKSGNTAPSVMARMT